MVIVKNSSRRTSAFKVNNLLVAKHRDSSSRGSSRGSSSRSSRGSSRGIISINFEDLNKEEQHRYITTITTKIYTLNLEMNKLIEEEKNGEAAKISFKIYDLNAKLIKLLNQGRGVEHKTRRRTKRRGRGTKRRRH